MKAMKAIELRKKSKEELKTLHENLCNEQFQVRMRGQTEEAPKTHLPRQARKNIARILTILNELKARV